MSLVKLHYFAHQESLTQVQHTAYNLQECNIAITCWLHVTLAIATKSVKFWQVVYVQSKQAELTAPVVVG